MKLDRREFLSAGAMAGLAGLLPVGATHAAGLENWRDTFHAALKEKPWLLAFRNADREVYQSRTGKDIQVTGKVPTDLKGVLWRTGPGGHEVGGLRYHHWFDGDGLAHGFRFDGGDIRHFGRMVDTPKRVAEQKAGRMLWATFGTHLPGSLPMNGPDTVASANINLMSHGGRLFAMWEGGSAQELDPETLRFRGNIAWSPETRGLPFAAHPRLDQDGSLWSFGYAPYANAVVLYHIRPEGTLAKVKLLRLKTVPMVHDFMITEKYVVLVLPPWNYEQPTGKTFLEKFVWQPERGGRVLVLDKQDFSVTADHTLPPFWVFHFGNAWEDGPDHIRFDFSRYDDPKMTQATFKDVMRGEMSPGTGAIHTMARLDIRTGDYQETPLHEGGAAEFARIDPRLSARRHRYSTTLVADSTARAGHPMFTNTVTFDLETGQADGFQHGHTEMAEEALFVPRPGGTGEQDGWILQTVIDFGAARSRLKIFDAGHVKDGPVAIATLPYALPHGLHGTFQAG